MSNKYYIVLVLYYVHIIYLYINLYINVYIIYRYISEINCNNVPNNKRITYTVNLFINKY